MPTKISFAVLFFIIQNVCFATMFSPLPFDKQVEEASSAVEATLENTKVFKNSSGLITTEYSFHVSEGYNLSAGDLENQKLKLSMLGGTLNGITSMIDGAPQFKIDEKSFLLLKKIDSKIYLSNFTLGKFKIQNDEGQIYYVSEVFPTDPVIGKISKEKMIELMKDKWKISQVSPQFIPFNKINTTSPLSLVASKRSLDLKRMPSQEDEQAISEEIPYFFWSAIAFFAFFFTLIFVKLGQSGKQYKSE
jgi:hypothetical protein